MIGTLDASTGGPPKVAACLSVAQRRLGHEASIACCPALGGETAETKLLANVPGADAMTVHHVPDSRGIDRYRGRAAQAALTPLIDGSDIVHLHGVWEAVLVAAARVAQRVGKPYVVTPHGMLDPWNLQHGRFKKRAAIRLWFARLWRGAAFFHMLNEDEARLIEPLNLGVRVEILPNGVFLEEIEPLPELGRFRATHPELGQDPFVLFLSRLHHKKGLDYLAGAFKKVARARADVSLVVAGPDEGARDDFVRRVGEAGLSQRVHLTGPLYGRAKYEALVDAACFCLPSRQEGFSMAVTESLACGTPVVVSENCHFPEVAHADAGYVVPLDKDAVAEALLAVLADETQRQAMGRRGAELMRSRYTWPRIAEQMLGAYRGADRA
ncbi:MAG: glycosyltransferase [Planctomycetota bacterium]